MKIFFTIITIITISYYVVKDGRILDLVKEQVSTFKEPRAVVIEFFDGKGAYYKIVPTQEAEDPIKLDKNTPDQENKNDVE